MVLHKLLEELLLGELEQQAAALEGRAAELLSQLMPLAAASEVSPDAAELASTALAASTMPELSDIWPKLVPETAVYGMALASPEDRPLSGRADAIVVVDGRATVVVDWKSDVAPGPEQQQQHAEQLQLYLAATGAPLGLLVYLTSRTVRQVRAGDQYKLPPNARPGSTA